MLAALPIRLVWFISGGVARGKPWKRWGLKRSNGLTAMQASPTCHQIGGKIRTGLIIENWPDILRAVAMMAAGLLPPSQVLKKFAA